MSASVFGAFVVTSILLGIAPGPDNLFILVNSSLYGVRAGLWVVLGLLTGIAVQTLAASLGVAAVVAASPVLFWGIRILGAAYLLYLAFQSWRHPVSDLTGAGSEINLSGFALWRRGTIMNITNPKVQIFFLAFFPQFVTRGAGPVQTVVEMLVLGVTFMVCTALVFGGIAVLAGSVADKLRSPRVQFWLNRTAAVIFVCLAAATLASG